jgi:SAM-dependent methyltransferase
MRMRYDVIFGNPPFQNNLTRNKTQHKLWKEFTIKALDEWLAEGGYLCWITPQSWGSPSNKILKLFKKYALIHVDLDTRDFFPHIGSSFSQYKIQKKTEDLPTTSFIQDNQEFKFKLSPNILYIPNDFCRESINIHEKVMFKPHETFDVGYDYVTCHNVIRHAEKLNNKKIITTRACLETELTKTQKEKAEKKLASLLEKQKTINISVSEKRTSQHIHPLLHTNKKTWYSSIRQDFAGKKKVMWSRSGYTKPFYDDGKLGCTDMGYYIIVSDDLQGQRLAHYLNSPLMQYVFRTAKWSGFGNEIVFSRIPKISLDRDFTNEDYYELFSLSESEKKYLLTPTAKKKTKKVNKSETKGNERIKHLGEVFTPQELVCNMMEQVPLTVWESEEKTFLDPACGNGNFLVEILRTRLAHGVGLIPALKTLYGVDIMKDNILESRKRLLDICSEHGHAQESAESIINNNIFVADALNYPL